jgi:hypothetical protein
MQTTTAVMATREPNGDNESDPRDAVRRALTKCPADLVARVRARLTVLTTTSEISVFTRSDFSHVSTDFTRDEVEQVMEPLVDLGQLMLGPLRVRIG